MISRGSTDKPLVGCHCPVNGSGNAPPASMFGRLIRRKSSSCAMPTVAISRTRRGLLKRRRTTVSSITMPMSAVATIAKANASQ